VSSVESLSDAVASGADDLGASSLGSLVRQTRWNNVVAIAVVHALAALAFVPWFFSWTGVVLALAGAVAFQTLGINLGYHRLLTHRALSCPRWLQNALAVMGACCLLESPPVWVAIHRCHHQHSDSERDPHSPEESLFWGYIGWMLVKQQRLKSDQLLDRYARDLMRDPFLAWLDHRNNWGRVAAFTWSGYYVVGLMAALLTGSDLWEASRFGVSLLVWGAIVRTVLVWHVTWLANTLDHRVGYCNYETNDNSRNNLLIALLSNGEGWHNNHHADPNSANHGHQPGEFDLTWQVIRVLMWLGLARDVVLPSKRPG
jgi:fatty-acid desaturase